MPKKKTKSQAYPLIDGIPFVIDTDSAKAQPKISEDELTAIVAALVTVDDSLLNDKSSLSAWSIQGRINSLRGEN